jgi:putative peptidoglycan lipid II flippase
MEKLVRDFVLNARLILFLVIPAATIAVLMRGYIVRLLFGFGDATTANTLGWFAGTIVFQALFFLISRMYYAMQDTKTPLYTSLAMIGVNVILSFVLSDWFGVVGLAMAQSIVSAIEALLLLFILSGRLGTLGLPEIWRGLYRMLLANAIMAGVVYPFVAVLLPLYKADVGFSIVAPKFFVIVVVAAITYLIPCYLLDLREARQFIERFKDQVLRPLNLV